MSAKKRARQPPPRQAQLVADTVAVCCPYCGEAQPNVSGGDEAWTKADFVRFDKEPLNKHERHSKKAQLLCVFCDKPMLVFDGKTAQFLK